jgi:hypothetical protein
MSDQDKSTTWGFVLPAVGIFVVCGLLFVLMLMSNRDFGPGNAFLNEEDKGEVYDEDPGSGPGAGAAATQPSEAGAEGAGAESEDEEDAGPISMNEQLSLALQAARNTEPAEDAPSCETHCDCPQGQVCVPASGLCVQTPVTIFCCDKEGCPDGAGCVRPNGSFSECGAE